MENLVFLNDVAVSSELLAAIDKAVQQGKANRSELITIALRRQLELIRRAEIDVQLAEMVNDIDYQKEVLQMEAEFATSQWEALKLAQE